MTIKKRPAALLASVLSLAALSGCAEESSGSGDAASGDGVPRGATMEEYQEAFADVDEITLRTQTPAAEGSIISSLYEEYAAAVTEWSDGKIKFDIAYASAVAPALEADNAIRDGLLDIGLVSPVFEPDQYPVNAALADATFIGTQSPVVGFMQAHASWNQTAFEDGQIVAEFEEQGLHALIPAYGGGANGIHCAQSRTTLDEINGLQVVASGRVQAAQLEALGATPVSFTFAEVFEALQRGAADCGLNSMRVSVLAGLTDVVPFGTFDDEAGFAQTPGAFVINQDVWEGLPLVAQQLLFDQLELFFTDNLEGATEMTATGLEAIEAKGGGLAPLADDAREALLAANEESLESIRSSDAFDGAGLIDGIEAASESWTELLTGELGYDGSVTWADYADYVAGNGVDYEPFVSRFFDDVMSEQRPS